MGKTSALDITELSVTVADLGDLGEHHRRAVAHQQVGGEAEGRVRRDAGEGIAATALHSQHQGGGRAGLAPPLVELVQAPLGQRHDSLDHLGEAVS